MGLFSFIFGKRRNIYREITEQLINEFRWHIRDRIADGSSIDKITLTLEFHDTSVTRKDLIQYEKKIWDVLEFENEVNLSNFRMIE
jgi:hypothetical protein